MAHVDRASEMPACEDPPSAEAGGSDPAPPAAAEIAAVIDGLVARWPFGPGFFLSQLRPLVRERFPEPSEGLPSVQVYLLDGDCLELCHVAALGPLWVALEVWEDASSRTMRTELVPYAAIARVAIRARRSTGPGIVSTSRTDRPRPSPRARSPQPPMLGGEL